MPNPFKYGGIVTGEDFADREEELKLLIKELTSQQNILLYSPRRYGKSSLMMMVLERLQKRGIITVFIDLYGCISLSDFIDKFIEKTVTPAYDTFDKVGNFLKSAFSGLRPEITLNPDGSIKISYRKEMATTGEKSTISKILDAPEKLAIAKSKPLVIVFDEFQEIANLDGDQLENIMRTHFQHHKRVTYVFMGSKRHLIERIFGDADRPFYKFARLFPLGKIPKEEFKKFALEKFKETNVSIDAIIVDKILNFTDGHPYFTQQLCHELWNIACEKGVVKERDVEEAKSNILKIQNDFITRIWDSLTLPQRKLLVAMSLEGSVSSIYSVSFVEKYELVSASHVARAIEQMLKEGIVEKLDDSYVLVDIFLREWVKATKT